ncbi:caspase family protein [Nostoc sp. FACHB-152]|uniref:caspase family protein n=1 Tax=unclassified Nostoc TaxID=2593658 RepID=UPI001689CCD7|nr:MULTISPECIES: caspase family protein [unclassified Nostoc]MBD2449541.1 caspase family protein [Nostoc sp. FACHB-152]MBD2470910.1 caspase family protein [Nostoc sp. FACHB-145]
MANYWAIAIGINQYQFFQPLRCAQADAEALKNFLVEEAGITPQRCLLMTDTSPPIGDRSTYPTKENILFLLEDLAAACWQPGDHVWFFFSGYGVNHAGQDYLMPVEGNPELLQETAIEVRSLLQSLQLAQVNVLVLLDINRASSTQADAIIGQETIELAKELQLATIISCEPEQFSRESSELGYGFFTAALLAALRSGHGSSLKDLDSYLSVFTPELCQHYWRPTQNPVAIIPSNPPAILPHQEVKHSNVVIPSTLEPSETPPQELQLNEEASIFPEENFAVALAAPPLAPTSSTNAAKPPIIGNWGELESAVGSKYPNFALETEKFSKSPDLAVKEQYFNQQSQLIPPSPEATKRFIPDIPQPYISRLPGKKTKTSWWQQFVFWGGGTMLAIAVITVVFLRNQTKLVAGGKILSASSNEQSARSALNPPKNQSNAQLVANSEESQKRNQAVLDLAKMSLRQTQASDLSLAIATARKIPAGEPLYEQAQENIKIWSNMILNLAEGRAKQRQYANAIAAAQLISKDELLYPQAQASINQWRQEAKQYLANKTLLDAANALIKPGQASTYNRAIEVAKRVPQGQPGFDLAQKSINRWSEKILDLAKDRAAEGNLKAAIDTAHLVPEVTAVYEDAQEAIQKWQKK